MKRTIVSALMLGMMAGTALAGTVDDVINNLKSQGFTISEVEKTFLGNVKIEANSGTIEREVVYSPLLDKVLRDKVDDGDDSNGGSNSNSFSVSSGGDNSDDDHDGDHDSGDDGGDHDSGDDGGDHDGGDHDGGHDGGDHDGGDD
jgi:phage major head subunit gpT-like protein